MRTNGLVWSLALALAVAGRGQAADDAGTAAVGDQVVSEQGDRVVLVSNQQPAASEQQPVAREQPAAACDSCEQPTCSQDLNTHIMPEGWCECLIGDPCAYHLYAGTEFIVYNVHTQTGGTITASFSDTTAPGVATRAFREHDGLDDQGFAPRVWLGAQLTDKWGVRGRYWRLGDSDLHTPNANPAIPTVGTNFGTFEMRDDVEASVADAEAVRSFEWGGWKLDGFVGGRHAEFSTDSSMLAFGVFTTGNFVNLVLQNGASFDGSGVTYGGELRRQIVPHLYAFGSARGSALDGHSDSFGRADGTVASSPSAPLVGAATVRRNDAEARLYIFELQGGLQFEWALQCLPANYFFRTAYEYQRWDVDGLPTGGAGFGGTIGEITTNSFSSAGANHAGMDLYGVSIGTGLTW